MNMKMKAMDDNPHHGKPSAHSSGWHTVWLLIHLIAVIAVTKMNASPLEALLTSMNARSPLPVSWSRC
ncbi:calcium/proton antiporter [Salmonella enterica subsp. enterica]|nr:calcium/proton antiporter [Salmonella enterica subsp. enterica]